MPEAKEKMLNDLGENAYIIDTNVIIKKKLLGLKREKFVEIRAGKSTLAR